MPAVAALLSACAAQPATPAPQAAAAPPPPGPAPAAPAPASEVVPLPPLPAYVCPDGRLMEVSENATAGTLTLPNGAIALRAAGSASAYVSGEITYVVAPDALRIRAGRRPEAVCPRRPDAPVPGMLWGTLDKRDRMALPERSRARVLLVDASRMDAPAEEVASTTLTTVGNQAPLHFLLRYDPDRIQPGRRYAVTARIEFPDGRLAYVTDTVNRVLAERPAEPALELLLVPARP